MFEQIYTKILGTLQNVAQVKQIINHPIDNLSQLTKYPAVVFYPDNFENSFETNAENFKTYRFRAFVFIGLKQSNAETVFTEAMPKVIDAIVAQFDAEWDGGTIDGHRLWVVVDNGRWDIDTAGEKGKVAFAELNIRVRGLTSN